MKHIVITAGGTVEKIDEVRQITNTSTGKLARLICKEVLDYLGDEDFTVHYIMSKRAVKPEVVQSKVMIYPVSDTQSVIDAIDKVYSQHKIDYFIHSMAVSDFTTSYIAPVSVLTKEISNLIQDNPVEELEEKIQEILTSPHSALPRGAKISSREDIILGLKRTPKVISYIKDRDPETFLVGFKLLNGVSEERLKEVACKLGKDNDCNLVLANDMCNINNEKHEAILLKDGCIVERFHTKDEIAKGIVMRMLGENK